MIRAAAALYEKTGGGASSSSSSFSSRTAELARIVRKHQDWNAKSRRHNRSAAWAKWDPNTGHIWEGTLVRVPG